MNNNLVIFFALHVQKKSATTQTESYRMGIKFKCIERYVKSTRVKRELKPNVINIYRESARRHILYCIAI